jgi:hypothetical protein
MSITTRGWGDNNITTAGWGGGLFAPIRRAFKRFISFIARRKRLELQHPRRVRFVLNINRTASFEAQIARASSHTLYIERRPRFVLNIDPKEVEYGTG